MKCIPTTVVKSQQWSIHQSKLRVNVRPGLPLVYSIKCLTQYQWDELFEEKSSKPPLQKYTLKRDATTHHILKLIRSMKVAFHNLGIFYTPRI